jgi:predicted metalloprotease with PDZ domain
VRHGRTERPYTLGDVRAALGRVTRDTAFANDFFRRYIAGREAPDYAALLAHAGILLRPAAPGAAGMGDQGFRFDTTGNAFIASGTLIGSPLYVAGLDRNDRVVSIDGRPIHSQADIDSVLAAHKAGDEVPLSFEGRSGPREVTLTFGESPRLESVPFEEADRPVTDEIRRFRASWLESRIGRE